MTHLLDQVPFADWPPRLWQALLGAWCLFWLLMLSVAFQDNWGDAGFRWWKPLVWELSSGAVLTCIAYLMLVYGGRRQQLLSTPWRWWWAHARWLPLASAAFVAAAYGIRHGIYALLGEDYTHLPWLQVWLYETLKLGLFLGLWLGIIFGIHAFVAARAQQQNLQTLQRALTEARLGQLTAQLEPHFLFNTLNTISALMHSDVQRADGVLSQLADLLRARLSLDERQLVPLDEELRLLRLYADIMCTRFAPRVQIAWYVDDAVLAIKLPVLVLQPIMENVFKHEVEPGIGPVQVQVRAQLQEGGLEVYIRNSVGTATDHAPSQGSGIGLQNCRERLRALYGSGAELVLQRESDSFVAILRVPDSRAADIFAAQRPAASTSRVAPLCREQDA